MTLAPLFGNPVPGVIHEHAWIRPPGNTEFRVTKSAAQHVADGGPPAIDLGDGDPDADAILSMLRSTVKIARTDGSANLECDHTDASGRRWRMVYAHNQVPHPVAVGQIVSAGQRIGTIGKTGATAAHLHLQIGEITPPFGRIVWLDPWPLLAQNRPEETDMTIIPAAGFAELVNKAGAIRAGTNYRSAPILSPATLIDTTTVQTEWNPIAQCEGDEANGSRVWYVGELLAPGIGHAIVFVHGSRLTGPLTPAEIVPDPTLIARLNGKQAALVQISSEAANGIAI